MSTVKKPTKQTDWWWLSSYLYKVLYRLSLGVFQKTVNLTSFYNLYNAHQNYETLKVIIPGFTLAFDALKTKSIYR